MNEYNEIFPYAIIAYVVVAWGYWWVYKKNKK